MTSGFKMCEMCEMKTEDEDNNNKIRKNYISENKKGKT